MKLLAGSPRRATPLLWSLTLRRGDYEYNNQVPISLTPQQPGRIEPRCRGYLLPWAEQEEVSAVCPGEGQRELLSCWDPEARGNLLKQGLNPKASCSCLASAQAQSVSREGYAGRAWRGSCARCWAQGIRHHGAISSSLEQNPKVLQQEKLHGALPGAADPRVPLSSSPRGRLLRDRPGELVGSLPAP